MQRAVLFDLDETLSDRPVSVRRMADVFVDRFGDDLNGMTVEVLHEAILEADDRGYRPREEMAEQLCARLPWKRAPQPGSIVELWRTWIGRLAEPMPGLHATLEQLVAEGFRLGVVTNGPRAGQNQKIDTLGIREMLSVIVTSEEAGCAKPDPWIFRRALDVLSADASSSWFVGDNPVADVGGAEGAGLRAVWIGAGSTWPDELPPPRYAIHRLEQLLDLVRIA